MTTETGVEQVTIAGVRVVRLAAFVRGKVIMPGWPRVGELCSALATGRRVVGPTGGAHLICQPDQARVLVVPAVDPATLVEPAPSEAIAELAAVPYHEVCAFVDAVGTALRSVVAEGLPGMPFGSDDRAARAFLAELPDLFDSTAVREMVDIELGGPAVFDDWQPVTRRLVPGISARMAERIPDLAPDRRAHADGMMPLLRAVPTRQLHLTAGNAPVVPVVSLLWAWATKGSCVIKPAAETVGMVAALAAAITAAGADHPLARHTCLVYWQGGERAVEDVLFADRAFDRRVVWGSAATVADVARRGGATDTIVLRPRHAVSLIGRAAVRADLADTARRAAVDSLVANQQACMSSLLHVVEGDDDDADRYADELTRVLARWDETWPHRPSPRTAAALEGLRRGLLGAARWRVNGRWPDVTSAVVRYPGDVDLRAHPGGRLVLVRAVPELRDVLGELGSEVANVGVAPDDRLAELRDDLAACGVDNILPLGQAERGYAGRPHDGMRVLDRLVRWVNA